MNESLPDNPEQTTEVTVDPLSHAPQVQTLQQRIANLKIRFPSGILVPRKNPDDPTKTIIETGWTIVDTRVQVETDASGNSITTKLKDDEVLIVSPDGVNDKIIKIEAFRPEIISKLAEQFSKQELTEAKELVEDSYAKNEPPLGLSESSIIKMQLESIDKGDGNVVSVHLPFNTQQPPTEDSLAQPNTDAILNEDISTTEPSVSDDAVGVNEAKQIIDTENVQAYDNDDVSGTSAREVFESAFEYEDVRELVKSIEAEAEKLRISLASSIEINGGLTSVQFAVNKLFEAKGLLNRMYGEHPSSGYSSYQEGARVALDEAKSYLDDLFNKDDSIKEFLDTARTDGLVTRLSSGAGLVLEKIKGKELGSAKPADQAIITICDWLTSSKRFENTKMLVDIMGDTTLQTRINACVGILHAEELRYDEIPEILSVLEFIIRGIEKCDGYGNSTLDELKEYGEKIKELDMILTSG